MWDGQKTHPDFLTGEALHFDWSVVTSTSGTTGTRSRRESVPRQSSCTWLVKALQDAAVRFFMEET